MSDNHVLYRFRDAAGELLYVGITKNPPARFAKHADEKHWWGQVCAIDLEHFYSREDLIAAEKKAIQSEHPINNIQHNRRHPSSAASKPRPHRHAENDYRFNDRRGNERIDSLRLAYEVDCDPVGDQYDGPQSAKKVFHYWRDYWIERRKSCANLLTRYPDFIVPITWYIQGSGVFESATPENYWWFKERNEWFGDFFTRPIHATSGEPLSSVSKLPVRDKQWTAKTRSKGGFIAEATGWKPMPLQRWVDLRLLTDLASA